MSTNAASTSEPRHWPTIIVGGIFFLVGALMGGISLWHLYDANRALVDVRIVHKDTARAERGGRRSTEYVARYRFEISGGRAADGHATLEPASWEAAKAGDRIRVSYLPDEPQINRPAGEGGFLVPLIFILIGVVFVPLGALIAWGSWLVRHDP